jgi:Glycosyl hydrolase family 115/Gylcosyl hydrolase family 115 C-terminal domain
LKKTLTISIILLSFFLGRTYAQIISEKQLPNSFSIKNAVIYVDKNDFPLVKKSAELLQNDIEMVTGKKLPIINDITNFTKQVIVIGSTEKSSVTTAWIKLAKIKSPENIWESYSIQSVKNPNKNIESALVISGNDRRGVAFGVFELSKQMGVSPWYWWADIPVKKKSDLYIKNGILIADAPKVKYRGIFINDEAPALSNWSKEKFGGFNHQFYEKVFELMLRLKANYLWPAMWGNAFYYDDSLNIKSADEYGIVIGTSHHEPLMRAHEEWKYFGKGKKWNYDSTEAGLKEFWRGGMQRAWNEKIVSVGMRGDGDEPMSRETATALLERIVKDQRKIIEEVTGRPASETPQLWALYKEVQDYYDKGMRVPDDVTLLLCDDNWGNIRKLPKLNEVPRKGGYGIYYHFDYVGGPRNYKWLNTNPIPGVWEQMHLAWEYKAREIWIVNVGDIKPMEFPISFFLDYAWNPEKIGADDLQKYTEQWAAAQFGNKYAKEIADIISKYTKYNGRRKPELLDANTYDLEYSNEFETVVNEYNTLLAKAEKINRQLPPEFRDAYFQLVLHPVKACANLNDLYYNVALNREAYKDKYAISNTYADKVKKLYINDSLISLQYHQLVNGKWNHMMDQAHIGYTYWQQPRSQKMPAIRYVPHDSIVIDTRVFDTIIAPSAKKLIPKKSGKNIFYETTGHVSIEAAHYSRTINTKEGSIKILPDLGKTGSAVTVFPVTMATQTLVYTSPKLEYDMYVYDTGTVKLQSYFSPSLNFHNDEGLRYAVAIDDELPQIIAINKDDNNLRTWEGWVANNIIIKTTNHPITKPGKHVLKCWMLNPGLVLQKLVVDFGGAKPSYLGPPETKVK